MSEQIEVNEELMSAISQSTFDSIKVSIEQALPVAEYLARITPTMWDDRVVAGMRAILDSDAMVAWLERILVSEAVLASSGVSRTTFIINAAADTATPDVREAAAAAGLAWDELLAQLPQIITLILTIMGKRR